MSVYWLHWKKWKTVGDVMRALEACEYHDEFQKWFRDYWNSVYVTKKPEVGQQNNDAKKETYQIVSSNIYYMMGQVSSMRSRQMKDAFWFLFIEED